MTSPLESRQFILYGGFVLQFLTEDEMILRKEYFRQAGIPITSKKGKKIRARDLIQICEATREILISRMNLLYMYNEIEDAHTFTEMVESFRDVIFTGEEKESA